MVGQHRQDTVHLLLCLGHEVVRLGDFINQFADDGFCATDAVNQLLNGCRSNFLALFWLFVYFLFGSWLAQHLSVSRQEPCLVKVVVVIQNLSNSLL